MKCPYCGHAESSVVDSRESINSIRRRRNCESCGKRFTTYERVEALDLYVIKKDGRREPFSREKIKSGFMKACEKRPVPMETIEKAVNDIETRVRRLNKIEVPTKFVGELVVKKLRKLDKVAYIRFASVYREFADLTSFEREINELLRDARKRGERVSRAQIHSRISPRGKPQTKSAKRLARDAVEVVVAPKKLERSEIIRRAERND